MEIRFASKNKLKIGEIQQILAPRGITIVPVEMEIPEIQTTDIERLVKDKVLKAFKQIGRPVLVEHTALRLGYLNGFPGGLTQIFWDSIGPWRCASLLGRNDRSVTAETMVGYTDAKRIYTFKGSLSGRIARKPREVWNEHYWDCVFIPDGEQRTFSQMGADKNDISMRRRALDAFAEFLTNPQ